MKLPLDPFQFALITLLPSVVCLVSGAINEMLSLTVMGIGFLGLVIWQLIVAAIEPTQQIPQTKRQLTAVANA